MSNLGQRVTVIDLTIASCVLAFITGFILSLATLIANIKED